MDPQSVYQSAAVASARLWESFEDEADPYVALQKYIDASQEMFESKLDKGVELDDTAHHLTSTNERLQAGRNQLCGILNGPEEQGRHQIHYLE